MVKALFKTLCGISLALAALAAPQHISNISPLSKRSVADKSQCNNLVALYWGQDSAASGGLTVQGPLRNYCDGNADVLILSFLFTFQDSTGYPVINFANQCDPSVVLPGTNLGHCPQIGLDISYCQSQGKVVLLSLGGWTATTTASDPNAFADQIWNLFLGGSSSIGRPFDSAVLDGIDWDIEHAPGVDLVAVSNRFQSHFQGASKKYYLSAAPFCSGLTTESWNAQLLTSVYFDWIWPQFYNDWCGNNYYPNPAVFGTYYMNFGDWVAWANNGSNPNPNVRILVGVPAGSSAANPSNFVSASTLGSELSALQAQYPNRFGGVMMWDASWAYDASPNYAGQAKQAMAGAAICNTPPPSSSTTTKTSTSAKTTSTSTTPTTTSIIKISTTTSSPSTTPTGLPACSSSNNGQMVCVSANSLPAYQECVNGNWLSAACGTGTVCEQSGTSIYCGYKQKRAIKRDACTAAPWNSTAAYIGGATVSYNGYTWTAKWWTQGDIPTNNGQGVWTQGAACGGSTTSSSSSFSTSSTVQSSTSSSTIKSISSTTTTSATSTASCTPAVQKVITGYFPNWLYSRYTPGMIDFTKYTHINYAFAVMYTGNTPIWADSGVLSPGLSYSFPTLVTDAHAAGVQVAISVGGWSGSVGYSAMVATSAGRQAFISWNVQFIQQYNTDGVDLDWEYPGRQGAGCNGVNTAQDYINFQSLIQELRAALDSAFPTVHKYITLAVRVTPFDGPNGPVSSVANFVPYVDRFHVMAFDVNGAWNSTSGPNAPFNFDPNYGYPASFVSGIQAWISAGVPPSKIAGAIPFYGRAQTLNVSSTTSQYNPGVVGAPLGDSLDGPWQDAYCSSDTQPASGIWRWSYLRSQGLLTSPTTAASPWIRNFDSLTQTPWLFNPTTRMFISYDDTVSVAVKANYVVQQGLAGLFVWSLDEDNGELLAAMQVARTPNPTGTTPACPTSSAVSSSATPTSTGTSGGCSAAPWNSATAYSGGAVVSYNGYTWTAKWWTQGDTPGSNSQVWTQGAACSKVARRSIATAAHHGAPCTDINRGHSVCASPGKAAGFSQCGTDSWASDACFEGLVCDQVNPSTIQCIHPNVNPINRPVGPKRPITKEGLKKAGLPPYNKFREM